MKKVKITAVRKADYKDLQMQYKIQFFMPVILKKGRFLFAMDGKNLKKCAVLPGKVCRLLLWHWLTAEKIFMTAG